MTDSALPATEPSSPDPEIHQFICSLTHDLRSPLTAARLSAQLIRKNLVEESKILGLLGRIITNIDRADHLIQGLLDLNRLTAGQKLPLDIISCDITSHIKECLQDLQTIYGERFIFNFTENLNGYWSPHDLKRVIENLASNAIKYGQSNSPVTIKLRELHDQIQISVHNQGNPIPVDQQARLFKPFQRFNSPQNSRQKGWGLGLAIVHEITEAHRGKIEIESSQETGTTFKITLPKDCRQLE